MILAVLCLAACAPAATSGPSTTAAGPTATPPAASPSATAEPTATPGATTSTAPATPAPAPTRTVFDSVVYPYSLDLPPGTTTRGWGAAQRQWNGIELISSTAPFDDINGLVDGALFILGTSWTDDLPALEQAIMDNVRGRGCGGPERREEVTLGDTSAIAWSHTCSVQFVVRVVTVVDGFAFVASEQVTLGKEAVAFDNLVGWLDAGLRWR